jgi:hypothetical protein
VIFPQIAGVGQHHIHAMHAIAGERQAGVNEHEVVSVFKDACVFTNLMQSPKGDHAKGGLLGGCRARMSVGTSHENKKG